MTTLGKNATSRLAMSLALFIIALSPFNIVSAQEQNPKSRTVIVDNEACGCELYYVDGIQTTKRGDLFGFKLDDGTEIVPPKYKYVDKFEDGYCVVMIDDYNQGLIDRTGREVVPCQYDAVSLPMEGMIRVKQGQLYGFYDTTGHLALEPRWRAASGFSEGLSIVAIDIDSFDVAYGFIDKTGTVVIKAQYDYAYPFNEGYAVVKQYERYGMIDHSGKECLPIKYLALTSMQNGRFFAVDALQDRLAMFNEQFKPLTDFLYSNIKSYGDGFYSVVRDSVETFLDTKGKERFGEYNEVGIFTNGFAMVSRNGLYGIIDRKGKVILPIEYNHRDEHNDDYTFYEGLAMVNKQGKIGYINTKGEFVIPPIYESGRHFSEGIAPVHRPHGGWGYIGHNGETAIPFVFTAASTFTYERATVVYKNEVYKINPQGKCVKNCTTFPAQLKEYDTNRQNQ